MTYQEAVAYLDSFANYERTHDPVAMRVVTLDRVRWLCQQLGDPQRRFRSILVAGTNGKGSICAMLYAMLRASSLRVGLYTSPALEDLRERIRTADGSSTSGEPWDPSEGWIGEGDLASLVTEFQPQLEASRELFRESPPTYFEIVTALAFVYFSRRQVEVAVVEVGLGGRLDATNVLEPAIAILSPIDVDHPDVLGYSPVLIAQEKAGIIKPKHTVISSPQSREVLEVIRSVCETQGAKLLVCGEDFAVSIDRYTVTEGLQLSIVGMRGCYQGVHLPGIGRHQASNAAVAVTALEALSDIGVPHRLVARGLADVRWPGRLEVISESPTVLLDGAHNPHAARALRVTIEELWPQRAVHLLLGMSSDKSADAIGRVLGPISASVTCTKSHHPRALDPTELSERVSPFCRDVRVIPDALDAYTYLLNSVDETDLMVVTGSIFLVGELRAVLRQGHITPRGLMGTAVVV